MISFPNAKINLGLNVVARQPDGYHNIESCFLPIDWCDILEIVPSESFQFSTSGLTIPGTTDSNLCIKAFNLIQENHQIGNVQIHLHKVIPMGGGLGGGSADCAFTLKLLNELFELQLTKSELEKYASQLGSDCPFFIENKPRYVTGTGFEFADIEVNLKGKFLALTNPNIHVGTKEAYNQIKPKASEISIPEILKEPLSTWNSRLKNDFETSVFPLQPDIAALKDSFYGAGAIYASMTGSGATVYGIFEEAPSFTVDKLITL
jgi:4-diphosphocytidyl-2-C-methyl-D-erythritol kinase